MELFGTEYSRMCISDSTMLLHVVLSGWTCHWINLLMIIYIFFSNEVWGNWSLVCEHFSALSYLEEHHCLTWYLCLNAAFWLSSSRPFRFLMHNVNKKSSNMWRNGIIVRRKQIDLSLWLFCLCTSWISRFFSRNAYMEL
jgi:hypothetical protein